MSNSLPINSKLCLICGASAIYCNYGVQTCDSCKVFFRRNAMKDKHYFQCQFNNNCSVTIYNRRICSACRMKKCLANGMQIELIRPRRSNLKHSNKNKTSQLNISSNRFTLNSNEKILLTQLNEYYNEEKLLSIIQQCTNQSLMMKDSILWKDFLKQIYETSGEYLRLNRELLSLSFDDRSAFLRNIAENVTCFSIALIWNLSKFESFSYLIQDICKYMDTDLIISKLALSLFAFSLHTALFSTPITTAPLNTWSIVQIQNNYAEVVWKYLLEKCEYTQSIRRFLQLIQCLLSATVTVSNAQNIPKHVTNIQALVEQTEIFFVVNDIEKLQ